MDLSWMIDIIKSEEHRVTVYMFLIYFFIKLIAKVKYGSVSWDPVCLVHNLMSVAIGSYLAYTWDRPVDLRCNSISDRLAMVVAMQFIHCVTEFLIYFKEMIEEPIFIWHHLILLFSSMILPYCPGCFYTAEAITLGELGSASIAIDAEWRRYGGHSKGFKRVLVFGLTRVIALYFLYNIYLVTPSKTLFSIVHEGQEVMSINIPICMITSVGGAMTMLSVNGVTWYRMFKFYMKYRKQRKENPPEPTTRETRSSKKKQ